MSLPKNNQSKLKLGSSDNPNQAKHLLQAVASVVPVQAITNQLLEYKQAINMSNSKADKYMLHFGISVARVIFFKLGTKCINRRH